MAAHNLRQHFKDFSPIYLAQALFNGSFYGIRAIFVLYAINSIGLKEAQAISLFATFMILCYGTSLIGGYIADKGLGVKNTIMVGGALSTWGLLCILFPNEDLCFLGLALTSLGSGFLKPNLSTAVGLLFKDPKDPEKDRAYSFLYIAMNLGSFVASIACGFIGKAYGWRYGILLVAGAFMGATYFVYRTMHFPSVHKDNHLFSKSKLFGSMLLLTVFLYLLFKYQESLHGLMGIIAFGSIVYFGIIFCQCHGEARKEVLKTFLYIVLFALFCTLFEQAGTSLTLFYEKAVDRNVMGAIIPASTLLSLDPLFVLLCGSLLIFLTSRYIEKKKPLDGITKIGMGFILVSFSFGVLALSTYQPATASIPIVWIIGAMFLQTLGELWIAPVTFSKISQHAPSRYKSILMSFWPLAIAYGHYFAGFIAQFSLYDTSGLSIGIPLLQYRFFFVNLGLLPLCIGLLLLLCKAMKVIISKLGNKKRLFLREN